MTTDLTCPYCPAARFASQSALTDHIEHACPVYAAERTARPRDPLAVLREALIWAIDDGALRLIPAEFHPLLEPARLRPGKPAPGFPASLIGESAGVTVRARITDGGRELHVHLSAPPREFQRTRVHLPAEFALPVERAPLLRDSRALAERLADAVERGMESERAEVRQ